MKKKKIILTIISVLLILVITTGTIDYIRVNNNKKPMFVISADLVKDGGSGKYNGLGYSFEIHGEFMPAFPGESVPKGITEYTFYILGIKVKEEKNLNQIDRIIYNNEEKYTFNSIYEAMDKIEAFFKKDMKDCKIITMTYDETKQHKYNNLIINVEFKTGNNPEQSLNKNELYTWNFILHKVNTWSIINYGE